MTAMTPDEYRDFLAAGTRTAKPATTRTDGRPHVVPVWFVLIEGKATTTEESAEVLGASIRNAGGHVGQELAAEYGPLDAGIR